MPFDRGVRWTSVRNVVRAVPIEPIIFRKHQDRLASYLTVVDLTLVNAQSCSTAMRTKRTRTKADHLEIKSEATDKVTATKRGVSLSGNKLKTEAKLELTAVAVLELPRKRASKANNSNIKPTYSRGRRSGSRGLAKNTAVSDRARFIVFQYRRRSWIF